MAFDDLAKRMGARPGVGASGTTDPDQIMAEAQVAAQRAARIQDLVLGPILLVGGLIVAVLWLHIVVDARTTTDPRNSSTRLSEFWYILVAAIAAIIVGSHKVLRGIGILKR